MPSWKYKGSGGGSIFFIGPRVLKFGSYIDVKDDSKTFYEGIFSTMHSFFFNSKFWSFKKKSQVTKL